jgi:putative addiction module component (TIGR02574 family)
VCYGFCHEPLNEILKFTPRARLEAVSAIWHSLDNAEIPLTNAQASGLDRRLETHQQNPTETIFWKDFAAMISSV